MVDEHKTRGQLLAELAGLRQRVTELERERGPTEIGVGVAEEQCGSEDLRDERDRAQQYLDIAGVMLMVLNERGEITESTIGNIALVLEGTWWTPPIECGLLPGVYRGELLERGELRERTLYPEDLARAEGIYLLNSVRRAWPVEVRC